MDLENLASHRIAGSFKWELKLNSLVYGDQSFKPRSTRVIIDTGSTISYLTPEDFASVIGAVCKNIKPLGFECQQEESYVYVWQCDPSVFKSIWFQIDS